MACSSRPPQLQTAAPSPPPARPRPPPPHLNTTLTLALPPRSLVCTLSPRPPHARRPRPDGGATASSSALATEDPPPCPECGRPFPSWKALFGHMRSHPERQWRGMTPPPHFRHVALAADQFTAQERDAAASLLMLSGARPGAGKGNKKNTPASSSSRAKESGSTSTSSPSRCGDVHKCGGCARVFATGQSLGRHKRRACTEVVVVVETPASSCSAVALLEEAPATTVLDLNLPPPGMPSPRKSDQGGQVAA